MYEIHGAISMVLTPMNSSLHIDTDRLELYILGRCDAASVDEVEQHLMLCPVCRQRSRETAHFVISVRQAIRLLPMQEIEDRETPDAACSGHPGSAQFANVVRSEQFGGAVCYWI